MKGYRMYLLGVVGVAIALVSLPLEAAQDPDNPYNSPIRRINPNSQQGTAPTTPYDARINRRPPTVINRGVGNGDNLRAPPVRQPQIPTPPVRVDDR